MGSTRIAATPDPSREAPLSEPDERDSAGLGDAALRSAFGFDADDDGWLAKVRIATGRGGPAAIGPYRLLEQAGRGAQGTVYRAVQPGTNRPIAIKRLVAGSLATPAARARFDREIGAVSSLSHPGVVTVLGADVVDEQPLLLMEWVDGEPIDRWALSGGSRPLRERLECFAWVCDAVSHAHQRGVVHRDLKPSNILVDATGRARVLDFGLAKLLDDGGRGSVATHAGFVGTPAYCSPEQSAGRTDQIDTRTDVFSLGVLLYQLITGRLPFEPGADLGELFRAIQQDDPAAPSRVVGAAACGSVGRELDAIALRAMAKVPQERYQSVDALAADVRRYLAGETVLAHPPSFLYQARKLVRRHRLPVGVGGAAVVLLAGAGVGMSILAARLGHRGRELTAALQHATESKQEATRRAQEAQSAQQKAEDESARSAANAEFLRDMIASLGTATAAGLAQPSAQMIADARGRLEAGEMAGQPRAEVTLWRTLAYAAHQSNLSIHAEECLARALALVDARFGPDEAETGLCALMAGLIAENRGDWTNAESLYRSAASNLERSLGEEHRETTRAISNLAAALKDLKRYEESEALQRRALAIRLRTQGPAHRDVAVCYRNLGTLRRSQQRPEEAAAFYEQAGEIAERLNPPDVGLVTSIQFHLAGLARGAGRIEEAERIVREQIDLLDRTYGAQTPAGNRVRTLLVTILSETGRKDEAADLAGRIAASYALALPPDHPRVGDAVVAHARSLLEAGRIAEAEARARDAVALAQRRQPASVRSVTTAKQWLARALRAHDRPGEAAVLEQEIRAARKALAPKADPEPPAGGP